jgi:hypothetical protein
LRGKGVNTIMPTRRKALINSLKTLLLIERKPHKKFTIEYLSILIAGVTAFAYLCTYYHEAGILKFYSISTRFISLDIHVFAMSWRALSILLAASTIWFIIYAHKENSGIKNRFIYRICIVISFLHVPLMWAFYLYVKFGISNNEINTWYIIIFFVIANSFWIYPIKKIKNKLFRPISILAFIGCIFAEGMGCSYINGYNNVRKKTDYYFIKSESYNVVIVEHNNYFICSKIINDRYIDSTFSVKYFTADSPFEIYMKYTGRLKPIKNQ